MQSVDKNIIIHHNEKPVCSPQLVAYLLSKEMSPDIILIFIETCLIYNVRL